MKDGIQILDEIHPTWEGASEAVEARVAGRFDDAVTAAIGSIDFSRALAGTFNRTRAAVEAATEDAVDKAADDCLAPWRSR